MRGGSVVDGVKSAIQIGAVGVGVIEWDTEKLVLVMKREGGEKEKVRKRGWRRGGRSACRIGGRGVAEGFGIGR
jgi:hypothetical protein